MESSERNVTQGEAEWIGATDVSRNSLFDYFIPGSLKTDFQKVGGALSPFLTQQRLDRFHSIVKQRTRRVAAVFEHTHHCYNISAILRTADAFGYQDVFYVYTDANMRFRLKDSVERGSSSWLSARRTNSVEECAKSLKQAGYKIVLVTLPSFGRSAEHFVQKIPGFSSAAAADLWSWLGDNKIALVFGNEFAGISAEWSACADCYFYVDMHGFVESLNISVCAGILLERLRGFINQKPEGNLLSQGDQNLLLEFWISRSVESAPELIRTQFPELWSYFDFLRKGCFYDPFGNLDRRRQKI